MDFAPNSEQQQILAALDGLLERHAGKDRALALTQAGAYDHALDQRLLEGGFHEIALQPDCGPLDAALAGFAVARAVGVTSYAAMAIVAPHILGEAVTGPVAIALAPADGPVRLGAAARTLLAIDGDEAVALETTESDWTALDGNRAGFPVARLREGALKAGRKLGPGSGARLRDWWRLEIAVQAAGLISGALSVTCDYLRERHQFGRPIGSFQAVQHRLARIAVLAEGARWLAMEAAYGHARPDLAASAAAYATGAADLVFRECHQLHGAIGFTREYPLHLWTLRLIQLPQELGGPRAHRRDAADLVFKHPETLALSVAPAV